MQATMSQFQNRLNDQKLHDWLEATTTISSENEFKMKYLSTNKGLDGLSLDKGLQEKYMTRISNQNAASVLRDRISGKRF